MLVSAGDVPSLSSTMQLLASQPDLVASMGAHSREHIRQYSPEAWSAGLARGVESAGRG